MYWIILIISSIFEAVWASLLGAPQGLSKPGPWIPFVLSMLISMVGLSLALKRIPVGTAYAVWTGLGGSLVVIYSMATGAEPVTFAKVFLISFMLFCILVLRMISAREAEDADSKLKSTGDE